MDPPKNPMVAHFDKAAEKHLQGQAVNPFSNDNKCGNLPRPVVSKEEYGKPPKGSLSESRGFKATILVNREMLQLCEIINECGEPLTPEENCSSSRTIISFGELFSIYTSISNKLVGILLRARKLKILDFEGEMLFQRRDDQIPIILLQPIEEIRNVLGAKIGDATESLRENDEFTLE